MTAPSPARLASAALLAALATLACDPAGDEPLTLTFAAQIGGAPFACDAVFTGVGMSAAEVRPLDFRIFLHDVTLIRADGERVALAVEDDGAWQRDGVVLLDFEDATGTCATGSAGMNHEIRGRAPAGEYVGVEFKVGIPESMNHLDGASAPAPLSTQGLWWSWAGGYKYMRLDLASEHQPAYYFHLGATACAGDPAAGFTCKYANLATVTLEGMKPGVDTIVIDGAAIFAGVDVDRADDPADTLPGCMAFPGDPECPAMLGALGLAYEDGAAAATQSLFRVEAGT